MKKVITLLLIVLTSSVFAQRVYYNQAVNSCANKSTEELIKCVEGTYLLDYDFTTINDKVINTKKTKKPILIIAGATWAAPFWQGVKVLNKVVDKYHEDVDFVIIFWDKKDKVLSKIDKFNEKIHLVPSRETDKVEKGNLDVSGFVHRLNYPTVYLIGKDKKVMAVKTGLGLPSKTKTKEEAENENKEKLEKLLQSSL